MAKIHEEVVVVKISKLVKTEPTDQLITPELIAALEELSQTILGESVIVEVIGVEDQ